MELIIDKERSKVVIRLHGDLDGSSACEVEQALRRLGGARRGCNLVFDLRGIRRVEYYGLALLAQSIRKVRDQFAAISLTGLEDGTAGVLRGFGLEEAAVF